MNRLLYETAVAVCGLLATLVVVVLYLCYRAGHKEDDAGLVFWLGWWSLVAIVCLTIAGLVTVAAVSP